MGLFSRKKKSKKSKKSSGGNSQPDAMQWNNSPLSNEGPTAHENPLYDVNAPPVQQTPTLDAFATEARKKQRKTGKGKGKKRMKDRHVGAAGGGHVAESANKVGSKTYKRNIGESDTNVGYFKSDDSNKLSMEANDAGIGSDANDTHMSARAVASSRLDKAMGVDVLSHDHFAKHGGNKGLVSAQVEGDAMMSNQWSQMPAQNAKAYVDAVNGGDMTDDDIEIQGHKVIRGDDGLATGINMNEGADYNEDVDLTNFNTLKGLADLQMMDYLTGQVDRHAGNIHIDKDSGTVTGIDNDLAFGTNNDALEDSKNFMGLPDFVDRMTANRFLGMSEKDFLKVIGGQKGDYGKLTSAETDAALKRYRTLRTHVEGLAKVDDTTGEDKLVDIWDKKILDQATAGVRDDKGDIKQMDDFDRNANTHSYIARAAIDLKR